MKDKPVFGSSTSKTGEKRTLTFHLDEDTFAFYDEKKWIVESGDFTVMAGSSSADIRISKKLILESYTVKKTFLSRCAIILVFIPSLKSLFHF